MFGTEGHIVVFYVDSLKDNTTLFVEEKILTITEGFVWLFGQKVLKV